MGRKIIQFIEAHVEKLALGLAAVFLLGMVGLYLVRSPNRLEYAGRTVGPGDLDEAVLDSAKQLERAVAQAKDKGEEPPHYGNLVVREQAEGIFGGVEPGKPALPDSLVRATTFGRKIFVPGLDEGDEEKDVVLVTPLRPSPPAVRTGHSLAIPRAAALPVESVSTPPAPESAREAVEITWVTVANYFDRKAQQDEMTSGHYAPYRSKVYIVGVDAQRQEVLANGEYSDWQDVKPGKAMPKIDIPDPVVDDQTGRIINKEQIDQAFRQVQQAQTQLTQPRFYEVEEGEEWEVPPLAGLAKDEDLEEDEVDRPRPQVVRPEPQQRTTRQPQARQPAGGSRRGGGSGGILTPGGGRGGAFEPPQERSGPDPEVARRKEMLAQAKDTWAQAYEAYKDKDFNRARDLATQLLNNEYAVAALKRKAKKLVEIATKEIEKVQSAGAGAQGISSPVGGSVQFMGPGRSRGIGPGGLGEERSWGGAPADNTARPLITNPQNAQQVAVWYHDDSVEAGKTYRYRTRVRLWNRYVGRMNALRNPEDAKKTVLVGEWSLASEPITVAPSEHLFVKSQGGIGEPEARIEVWKWLDGNWVNESFSVRSGDVIGDVRRVKTDPFEDSSREDVDFTTNAVVLDVRLDEPVQVRMAAGKEGGYKLRDSTSVVVVYLDPADGQVKERSQALDRYDPILKKLEDEQF